MQNMYYIGLDMHKRTINYCVKDGSGTIDIDLSWKSHYRTRVGTWLLGCHIIQAPV